MPIYAVDEHELMQEESTLKEGDAEIQDGTLYLTDRRLIYEKAVTEVQVSVYLLALQNESPAK